MKQNSLNCSQHERPIMTNQQGAPEALRPIARYKIGYATDGWGMRSSTPSGIPHHAGAWVRYEDHVAALVEAQQPAPSAAAADGWKLVPVKETPEMLTSVYNMVRPGTWLEVAQTVWRTMVDAAPQPSPTPQADSQPAPPELLKFYGVATAAELISAQARHIERLQAKLPQTLSFAPQRAREG